MEFPAFHNLLFGSLNFFHEYRMAISRHRETKLPIITTANAFCAKPPVSTIVFIIIPFLTRKDIKIR
jgi:hypothetical protein